MQLYTDNQAALTLLKNPFASARSKHIDINYHLARERVARKEIKFDYCPTEEMIADIMTKALAESKFKKCCKGMPHTWELPRANCSSMICLRGSVELMLWFVQTCLLMIETI